MLAKLLKAGKFLFILTNAHYDYLDLVMTRTLGKYWADFFDLIVCNAQKPLFTRRHEPFYELNKKKPNYKGQKIFDFELIKYS